MGKAVEDDDTVEAWEKTGPSLYDYWIAVAFLLHFFCTAVMVVFVCASRACFCALCVCVFVCASEACLSMRTFVWGVPR